jgi:G:T/U-mismatch repair DNA glycosylase
LAVNDFDAFLTQYREIDRVFVNGLTALEMFEKHVATALPVVRLPSSSGALPMSLADKLESWRVIVAR